MAVIKSLIYHEGVYKTYSTTASKWTTVTALDPQESHFTEYGMDDLSIIPESGWALLPGNFEVVIMTDQDPTTLTLHIDTEPYNMLDLLSDDAELLYWDPSNDMKTYNGTMTVVPKDQLVLMQEDISLADAGRIVSMQLTATGQDYNVRLIVSTDSGVQWKTWMTDHWERLVGSNLLEDTRQHGLTIAQVNNLTSIQWAELFSADRQIRFGFLLCKTLAAEDVSYDAITMTFETFQHKTKAPESAYTYEYTANNEITIKLLSNGSYIINVPEPIKEPIEEDI